MDLKSRLEQVERAAYAQAAAASDTVRAVALRLGVTRQTAARRLSHFELEPGSKDQTPRTKTWSS